MRNPAARGFERLSNTVSSTVMVPGNRMCPWARWRGLQAYRRLRVRQRVAQRLCDASGGESNTDIVLAERHVRAVLSSPAHGNDDRRASGFRPSRTSVHVSSSR
jgi:hypothetical protein